MACSAIPYMAMAAPNFSIKEQNWVIEYNEKKQGVDFIYQGNSILSGVFVKAKSGDAFLSSTDYPEITLTDEIVSDCFGNGTKYTVRYSGIAGLPDLLQVFFFYPEHDYFLTEVQAESATEISSNYMAPIATHTPSSFLPQSASNRILSVPFDNDSWVRYLSSPLTTDTISFEVTSVFNGESRKGLVIGSVEHDTWKTGIRFSTKDNQRIEHLECFGGIAHAQTRDVNVGCSDCPKTTKEHGSIKGTSLKSPKMLVGMFDDWRQGLETYGEANALVAPRRTWITGTPFGWNSWGGMEKEVNYASARDVSAFIKDELQPRGFENEGITYMGLDSYWDINMSDGDLMNFVKSCKQRGQKAGIYWTPFSYWSNDGERYMEGTDGQYKYKDAYLYANGQERSISGRSLDPTHPGVKMRIKYQIELFKKWGFEYIKFDFMNNGSQEADSYYEPSITTGMQAYNHGMQYLMEQCGDDMFMALSIAPTFPSQYAHSKRISCDVWGAMNDVYNWTGSTEYLLNSLSFGWWLDRVYTHNDPDHIVLYDEAHDRMYSESENRARITSAVIIGLYMLGDNLSLKGGCPGTQTARDRVLAFATNKNINEIAKQGRSFYPVEGYKASGVNRAENFFMLETDRYLYLAVFNYHAKNTLSGSLELSRLGAGPDDFQRVVELWTGEEQPIRNTIAYDVPTKDVRVYRLEKKGSSQLPVVDTTNKNRLSCLEKNGWLSIFSNKPMSDVWIVSLDGRVLQTVPAHGNSAANLDVMSLAVGTYIASAIFDNGETAHIKFVKQL